MAVRVGSGRSGAEDAAHGVLAELGYSVRLDVEAVRTYLGLELRREDGLPAKVRGVLDVQERLIVVAEGLPRAAEEHVILHEGGHYHLPHHRALFYRCSAFDLDASVRRRLEAEANTFATALRFGGVPEGWMEGGEPSVARVRELADMTGASFESSVRWFVEHSDRPVWALACEAVGTGGRCAGQTVKVRYGYRSPAARPVPWPPAVPSKAPRSGAHEFPAGWPIALKPYHVAGATAWDVYVTAYWTCVLVW